MIAAEPSLDVAALEGELRQEDQGPLQFYMDRLLGDSLLCKELLYRLRDAVNDRDIKLLIDRCLESTRSKTEIQKEHNRLEYHASIKRDSERIDKAIFNIEKRRRKNKVIEGKIQQIAERLQKDPKLSKEELKQSREFLMKFIEDKGRTKKLLDANILTIQKKLRELTYVPMRARKDYTEAKDNLGNMRKIVAEKTESITKIKLQLDTLKLSVRELDLALEKNKLKTLMIGSIAKKQERPKLLKTQQPEVKRFLLGAKPTGAVNSKYVVLLILWGITASFILAIKAAGMMNN